MPYCRRCGAHLVSQKARFCEVCGAWLTTASDEGIPRDIGSGESLIGYTLDGVYRLDEVINRGATAVVYRGTNIRLGQPVAVKVLLAAFLSEDPVLTSRFEAEARVQAKLHHPSIIAVQDFVSSESLYSIVMEYFDGDALDQALYELDGPMAIERIREVILPVFDAIEYAHEQAVVHRDIKPSNILLARIGGREYPKVMDFGIAKVLAETAPEQTAPGAMLGTLLYMSPEQCKALKSIDKRSDIYSLGVTLYQMATGMVPFYAESAFDIMMAHVQTPPPPPRSLVADIPQRLEEVILKALRKDPAERFQNVGEMRDAFEGVPLAQDDIAPLGSFTAREAKPSDSAMTPDVRPGRSSLIGSHVRRSLPDLISSDPDLVAALAAEELEELEGMDPAVEPAAPEPVAPAEQSRSGTIRGPQASGPLAPTPSSEAIFTGWDASAVQRLRLRVPSTDDWERFFDPNIFGGGVFCPTQDPPPVGTPVRVEITFVAGPRIFVHGVVTWRRPQLNDPRARAGVGVQVHPSERNKIAYVNGWARGAIAEKRSGRRLPVKLMVTYTARSGRRVNFTRDITEVGVFLRSRELLDLNTPIRLLIVHPGYPPFDLKGRVTRVVNAADDRGMGIVLHFADADQRERFATFVETLETKFLAGKLPDELLA